MERILIVRLGAMGDVIHALPAVSALRNYMPQAAFDWVIEERWLELLAAKGTPLDSAPSAQKPLINNIFPVNTKAWRSELLSRETRQQIANLRRALKSQNYSTAVDVQGALKSAIIPFAARVPRRIGFAQPREAPAKLFYTQKIAATQAHIIDQNFELAERLAPSAIHGGKECLAECIPTDPAAEAWFQAEERKRNLNKFAILNPGAGWGAKQWPVERFGQVSKVLAKDGIQSLINVGPGEQEAALARRLEEESDGAARSIQCSIGELISLTRHAALFIGGDTGPMHLANALGVPIVALFGPTDPARNGPYFQPFTVLRHESSETSYSHKKQSDSGLEEIGVDEVVASARNLLS